MATATTTSHKSLSSPHSPLEAVKSMATVKLIWVLGERRGVTQEGAAVGGSWAG